MTNAQITSHPTVFTTKTPYVLPSQKYMIPATWRRYQLSELINKVLSLPQPVPFDFLIRGEVLRASIGEWCSEHNFGEEETLELEYFESLLPPQRMASISQDDWVSSVSCQVPGNILAGSYDANVHIFDASQKPIHTIAGHTGPVASVCWVGETRVVASASHDHTARLTSVPEAHEGAPTPLASLHLHTAPVSSVVSDRSGTRLLTASWDTLIGVWTTNLPEQDEVVAEEISAHDRTKRRRLAEESHPVRKTPELVLKSHMGRVSRALFSPLTSPHEAYSCALDSTIRSWDIELGLCTSTITLSEKPLTDLAILANGSTALGASTDRTVSILDLRASTTNNTPVSTMLHPAMISTLAAHITDEWRVMSGAYDGIVRFWDTRSAKGPVASLKTEKGGKVLSVDWGKGLCALGSETGLEVWKISDGYEQVKPESTLLLERDIGLRYQGIRCLMGVL